MMGMHALRDVMPVHPEEVFLVVNPMNGKGVWTTELWIAKGL